MNTTLTRIAMAAPIVAALLALTSGWNAAEAKPFSPIDDITTTHPVVDPPKPPKPPFKDLPIADVDDFEVDPGDPEPPADDPAPPADTDDDSDDDSDHDDDKSTSHGTKSTGGSSRPYASQPAPVRETDTVFQAGDARNASESVSTESLQSAGFLPPTGVILGLGAALMAVIGWAAYRHHRLSI